MLIKTKNTDSIINFLKKELLTNMNIIGVINNVPDCEIYVDDVENPNGVFVRKDYFNYLYSQDDNFIDEICDTLFKDDFYGLAGVEESIAEKIRKKFENHWHNPCGLYYMPKENLDTSLIKTKAEIIDIKDAPTIDKYYEYKSPDSLDRIKDDIKKRPSSAIYENGEIVSWVLIHSDNSMGIMYTKDDHRRKGYAIDVTIDLASKIIDNGDIPFIHIVKGNDKSEGLAERCGFVKHEHDAIWFGVIAGIPKELIKVTKSGKEKHLSSLNTEELIKHYGFSTEDNDMYLFLDNFKEVDDLDNNQQLSDFKLEEVKDENMKKTWCDITLKGYNIPTDKAENVKKDLYEVVTRKNNDYKLYIGMLDEKPISSVATLDINEWSVGLHLLSTVPDLRRKGFGAITLSETIKKLRENDKGLVIVQSSEKHIKLFEKCGFKISN